MKLEDILPQLQEWFLPDEHKERDLPGGGRWFFVPHQIITQRLNTVCPGHWSTQYSDPITNGDYTVIRCELTICGVTRTGIGDDKTFPETNERGKAKIIGTPAIRAFRNAFKDACEQFGVCAYLDEQKGRQGRDAFVRYMQGKGDARAAKFSLENGWNSDPTPTNNGPVGREKLMQEITAEMKRLGWGEAEGRDHLKRNFAGKETRAKLTNNELGVFLGQLKQMQPQPAEPETTGQSPLVVSEPQQKRFWAIATKAGYTNEGVKALLTQYGITSSKDITIDIYKDLCDQAEDPKMAIAFNQAAETVKA